MIALVPLPFCPGPYRTNLVINSPAPVRSKDGRIKGSIERPSPDSYAAFEPKEADFPAIVIAPIHRKHFDEVWNIKSLNMTNGITGITLRMDRGCQYECFERRDAEAPPDPD